MTMVNGDVVLSDSTTVIYNPEIWLMALLESRMHMAWMRAIGGKLKSDYRYSGGLVYNTFPIPRLTTKAKEQLQEMMLDIMDLREELGGELNKLYDVGTMPEKLKELHEKLDGYVDGLYRQRRFDNDVARLETLLRLYEGKVN